MPLTCFAEGFTALASCLASCIVGQLPKAPVSLPLSTNRMCAQAGIQCVVLKGSMTMEQRDRMIDAFTNDASVTVFLMSLKAGGAHSSCTYMCRAWLGCSHHKATCVSVETWEGAAAGVALNLTAASHVFLMDPWCASSVFRSIVVACSCLLCTRRQ